MVTRKSAIAVLIVCLLLCAGQPLAVAATIRVKSSHQPDAAVQQPAAAPSWESEGKSTGQAEPYGAASIIRFSNGYSIDTRIGEPELPAGLQYQAPKGDEYAYYIVQFRGPIQPSWRQSLEASGAQVMSYLPNYAFLVRMNETVRATLAATKGEINWTGLYQPAYKISDRVAARAKGGSLRAQILLFTPENTAENVAQIEAIVGHKILYKLETEWAPGQWNRKIFVDVTQNDLTALANLKGVFWIEPMEKFLPTNYNSQVCVQNGVRTAGARPIWGHGITGQGQIIMDLDTGCRPTQNFFTDNLHSYSAWYWDANHRKVVAQQPAAYADETALGWTHGWMSRFGDEAANAYHGTHTSGSLVGKDTAGTMGNYNGMARDARLLFIDGGGDSGAVFGVNDINRVGAWAQDSLPAHLTGLMAYIGSFSWGDSSANGKYTSSAMEADQFMWSHKDYLFFFADDNDGTKTQPGSKAGSPATNKSGVAVGALTTAGANGLGGAAARASYSSYGDHVDGRLNPFCSEPGSAIISANGGSNTGTLSMDGTSMATPITAGTCAMLRQYYTDGWYPSGAAVAADGFTPSAALMRATLAVCCDSVTSTSSGFALRTGTADNFGFGRPNLDTGLYFAGDNMKLLVKDSRTGLVTGDAVDYYLNVPAAATNLRICLAWTDYPGATLATPAIVNDLNLDAYEPGGVRYRGNRYTTATPFQSTQNPANNDSVNVTEGIKRVAPAAGTWKITVSGRNVPMGPQPYALVVTYRIAGTATMGKVTLDKAVYGVTLSGGVGDTVRIQVDDANRTAAACTVQVYSKLAEPSAKPETLVCSSVGNGLYSGAIPLWMGSVVHGDGRLTVDQRDTIFVLFTDDNPAFTDTAKAAVDAALFTITNVRATDPVPPNANKKIILWNTSENASQNIYYGTTTALGSVTAVDTPLVKSHRLTLSGLTASTTYYFDAESRDSRGNIVRDNNGGRHYSFTTGSSSGADVLVVVLNDNLQGVEFYHPEFLTQALNVGGWAYDWWSTKDQGPIGWNTGPKLKNYKAVYFQVGQENYPPWTVAQKESIKVYRDNGGRFSMTGHDIGWAPWYATYSSADTLFCKNYLKFRYRGDCGAVTWTSLRGAPGDPISGAYTAGVTYAPPRTGFGGDSIVFSGTGIAGDDSGYVWNGNAAQDSCGVRWQSAATMGAAGNGVWGGYKSRVVTNAFEITQIDTANKTNASVRVDILNKMFIWLIGHNHPVDTILTPVAGNTYTASPISISWNAYAQGGATIDTTWVEYSDNGGSSWNILTSGNAVTSPYNWDISALENGTKYQVRVRVKDTGVYPSMAGFDTVGNFTIKKASGGDFTGPIVVPGSILFSRNPVSPAAPLDTAVLTATISDSTTGLSNISAARCSLYVGGNPYVFTMAPAGGSFDAQVQLNVADTIVTAGWPAGTYKLFVWGADNSAKALRWGLPDSTWLTVADNLGSMGVIYALTSAGIPTSYGLGSAYPNPSRGAVSFNFQLPKQERVTLAIYNISGQLVKTLTSTVVTAGRYRAVWDGRDRNGRSAASGIYMYRLATSHYSQTGKLIMVR